MGLLADDAVVGEAEVVVGLVSEGGGVGSPLVVGLPGAGKPSVGGGGVPVVWFAALS